MPEGILKFTLIPLFIVAMASIGAAQDGMVSINAPEQLLVPGPVTFKAEIQNRLASFKGAIKDVAKPLPKGDTRELTAIIMQASGRCQWRVDEQAAWKKAAINDSLASGAYIRTGLNSTLTLRCGLNSTVLVDSNSRVQLPSVMQDGETLRTIVTINRGRADIQVDRVGLMNDFSVLTPSGSLAVKGTGMGVQYDGFTGTSVVGARHNRMNAIEMRYFMTDGYQWLMSGGAISTNAVQNPATVAALETQPAPSLQAYEAEDAGSFDSAADQAMAATDTTSVTTRVVLAQQQQTESESIINSIEQEVIAGILAQQEAALIAAIEAAESQLEEEIIEEIIEEELEQIIEEIIEEDMEDDDTQPPQDILNSIGYSQYFGQMNGPSDQGFLAAAMALDLVAAQGSNWGFTVNAQITIDGIESDLYRRQIPIGLEPLLNALGDSNARTQGQFDTNQFDTFNGAGVDLIAFYDGIAAIGAANPQWYQENGAPPTRNDLAIMVESYENYISSWTDGNLNTEQARIAFTDALFVLYLSDPVNKENSQFNPYGQALLQEYVPNFTAGAISPPQNIVIDQ
jgi:hypothetical protein